MKTIYTKKIIYTNTMKIFFFHSKTEADQKKCINIPNNVPFYFLQLPSPLSFEREASLFVQINQYKNNNPILWNRMVTLASAAPDLAEALSSSQKTYSRPVPHREALSWHLNCSKFKYFNLPYSTSS